MLKKTVYFFLLIILTIPVVDMLSGGFIKVNPLGGDYTKTKDISLSKTLFLTGEFQTQKSLFINENLNLYPFFVRLHNQYLYSIFDKTNAFHTVVGKDNYLFDETYISAYFGKDFLGEKEINKKVSDISFFKDILESYNKKLVVCLLPGKASFYPEKIPTQLTEEKIGKTNIDYFSSKLIERNIAVLNLKDYLIRAKDTSNYSLYPKYGIHLSSYGTIIAADTLIKFIENETQKDIPKLKLGKIETTNKLRYYDDDVYQSINLLLKPRMDTMAYAEISYTPSKDKCKVLTIGDSFYKYIYDSGIHSNAFDQGDFWFYCQKVWPLSTQKNVKDIDIKEEVLKNDVIVLYATEATLYRFPFKVTEIILPHILPNNIDILKEYYLLQIDKSRDWQNQISIKAQDNHISFDEQKNKDIEYLAQDFLKNNKPQEAEIQKIISRIRADENWLNNVKQKAQEKNISIEEMLRLDAEYIYKTDKK